MQHDVAGQGNTDRGLVFTVGNFQRNRTVLSFGEQLGRIRAETGSVLLAVGDELAEELIAYSAGTAPLFRIVIHSGDPSFRVTVTLLLSGACLAGKFLIKVLEQRIAEKVIAQRLRLLPAIRDYHIDADIELLLRERRARNFGGRAAGCRRS